jgi:hypothetical protein
MSTGYEVVQKCVVKRKAVLAEGKVERVVCEREGGEVGKLYIYLPTLYDGLTDHSGSCSVVAATAEKVVFETNFSIQSQFNSLTIASLCSPHLG